MTKTMREEKPIKSTTKSSPTKSELVDPSKRQSSKHIIPIEKSLEHQWFGKKINEIINYLNTL